MWNHVDVSIREIDEWMNEEFEIKIQPDAFNYVIIMFIWTKWNWYFIRLQLIMIFQGISFSIHPFDWATQWYWVHRTITTNKYPIHWEERVDAPSYPSGEFQIQSMPKTKIQSNYLQNKCSNTCEYILVLYCCNHSQTVGCDLFGNNSWFRTIYPSKNTYIIGFSSSLRNVYRD